MERQSWYGSLIEEKSDDSGLMYMRNRYYNPITGQFTQEDPLSIAGGLHTYGSRMAIRRRIVIRTAVGFLRSKRAGGLPSAPPGFGENVFHER